MDLKVGDRIRYFKNAKRDNHGRSGVGIVAAIHTIGGDINRIDLDVEGHEDDMVTVSPKFDEYYKEDKPKMQDQKFIVFKRDEFVAWRNQAEIGGAHHDIPEPHHLEDAVVIRKTDAFAAPVLHAYASMVLTAMEVLRDGSGEASYRDLESVHDYFMNAAQEADETQKRFPTP